MTVQSIVDIDLTGDDKFKAFAAEFEKYRAALAKLPGSWAATDKAAKSSFESVAAAMLAQNALVAREAKAARDAAKAVRDQGAAWRDLGRHTKTVAGNIEAATKSLLKWTALTGVFSGLLGAGGLFGIDRLAASVSGGTRSAQGLGVSYGEKKAFGVDLGRVVDPDNFLSGVNEALHDVTKRYALYGAGLTNQQIAGKDTAQVAAALLPSIKRLLDAAPENQVAQVLQARGLGQFLSLEDAQRLRATPAGQLGGYIQQFQQDQQRLGLQNDTQRAWQDLSVQLSRAGEQIENVLVKGLTPLAVPLEKISAAFADVLQSALANPHLKAWLDDIGKGIEKFAAYVGTDDFSNKVKSFVDSFSYLADKVLGIATKAGFVVDNAAGIGAGAVIGGAVAGPLGAVVGAGAGAAAGAANDQIKGDTGRNYDKGYVVDPFSGTIIPMGPNDTNPGNLRNPGGRGFQTFANADEGLRAMARQLRHYEDVHHLDTERGIISRYAPGNENNTAEYIRKVANETGYGADDKLDLHDPAVLAKLEAAMLHREKAGNAIYTPNNVQVVISDNTGGNVNVSTAQVAH